MYIESDVIHQAQEYHMSIEKWIIPADINLKFVMVSDAVKPIPLVKRKSTRGGTKG